jgi:phosphoglycerate dehydrogenase-like enzyme
MNMTMKAAFFGSETTIRRVYSRRVVEQLQTLAEFVPHTINRDNLEEHAQALRSVEVGFSTWGMPSFSEEDIRQYLPNLRVLFYGAGSVQRFARPFLACGIDVVSAWAANAIPVAEFTVAQIVLANKGFHQAAMLCKTNRAEAVKYTDSFPGNWGAKVGIIGAGMIGKKVIEMLKPYNLDIYVYDPFLDDETAARLNVKKAGLTDIFSQCQTISNHVADLPATAGMLNRAHFDIMLPNATFINTGRGRQVVEEDLIAALKAVPTRTAILDVTYPEPVRPDSEFLKMDNVILTPHMAGSKSLEVERMAVYMLEEYRRYLNGEPMLYKVSLSMLETMA